MAKVGFEYIYAAKLDVETSKSLATAAYTEGREIGPGANITVTPTTSDVKDYGDDRVVETDVSVTGGTLNFELNEPTQENEAWLLGHTYHKDTGNEKGDIVRNVNDVPPYIGIAFVGKSMHNGKLEYKAKIYLKAQFREPSDEHATKEENVTFTHTTLEGSLFQLENGDWKTEKLCATLTEAQTFITSVLGES